MFKRVDKQNEEGRWVAENMYTRRYEGVGRGLMKQISGRRGEETNGWKDMTSRGQKTPLLLIVVTKTLLLLLMSWGTSW